MQQLLRPIHIGHDALEHTGTLQHARFYGLPLMTTEQKRKQAQRPRPLRALGARGGIGLRIHVIGHAVVVNLLVQLGHALVKLAQALRAQGFKKISPQGRKSRLIGYILHIKSRATQFIKMATASRQGVVGRKRLRR